MFSEGIEVEHWLKMDKKTKYKHLTMKNHKGKRVTIFYSHNDWLMRKIYVYLKVY